MLTMAAKITISDDADQPSLFDYWQRPKIAVVHALLSGGEGFVRPCGRHIGAHPSLDRIVNIFLSHCAKSKVRNLAI